jgi:hypothetical protein
MMKGIRQPKLTFIYNCKGQEIWNNPKVDGDTNLKDSEHRIGLVTLVKTREG